MNEKDVVIGQQYRVTDTKFSKGMFATAGSAVVGGLVTIIDGPDEEGDFTYGVPGDEISIGGCLQASSFEPPEWERDFLGEWARAAVSEGKFLLELTEEEVKALANGNSFLSIREKAIALLPKRKITIELDEDEVKIIDSAFAGETPDGTLFYPIQSKMYAALKKD